MGGFWEEASDVISFSLSLHEFIKNPNWKTGGWLALDTAAVIIPLVPAVGGYIQKSAKAAKAADKVLGAAVIVNTANKGIDINKMVIGKYPKYIEKAKELKCKAFNVPQKYWDKMSDAEKVLANQKSLDRVVNRGGEILLSNDPKNATGAFANELKYLKSKYNLVPNKKGTKLIKKDK